MHKHLPVYQVGWLIPPEGGAAGGDVAFRRLEPTEAAMTITNQPAFPAAPFLRLVSLCS